MKGKRVLLVVVLFLAALGLLRPQPQAQPPAATTESESTLAEVDRRILVEIADNSEQMENLKYLADHIGARLTGSEALKRANLWAAQRFRDYGLQPVRLEAWNIEHSWRRGTARARVVAPAEHALAAEAAGWSPNTPGAVRGPLLYVEAETEEDLEAYRGRLRGAIVIAREPHDRERKQERPLHPREPEPRRDFRARLKFDKQRARFFQEEGVVGVLRDSDKSFGLFSMTVASFGFGYNPAPLPTAFLTPESYDVLWRLREGNSPVEVELDISGCEFSDGPVEVYNTVAELPGSEKPDEYVLLGAHLDSWDLATGATDNGTGVSAVLEAARALKALGLKPKRTIRFVLFSGEEQGLYGSHAYVAAHKDELEKTSAVLVHDSGTGRVRTLALNGQAQAYPVLEELLAPLRQMIGLEELSLRGSGGSDHAPFNRAGVPGFFCLQEMATYRQTHHSQADTFEKVIRKDLLNGAQVLAVFAYNVAQADDLLPRSPAASRE